MRTTFLFKPVAALFAGAAIVVGGLTAPAAAETVVKIGTVAVAPHPGLTTLERFGQLVSQRTDGEIEIKIFPNAQLGGEKEMAEGMRLGSVEGAAITLASVSAWEPDGGIFDLPFIFRDDDHALQVYNGPVGAKLAEKYPEHGFRVLGFILAGVRNLFSTFPIETPADVVGKKMRTLQSPLHIELWSLAGANPTPIPHPEVYNALQTKIVDYADNTKTNYLNEKWYEVAPYFMTTGHIYAISAVFMSEQVFQQLSAEHQKILVDTMREMVPIQHHLIQHADEVSLGKAADVGATVIRISDTAPWVETLRPIWDQWAGDDDWRKEMIAEIQAVK